MQLVHALTSDFPLRPFIEINNIPDMADEYDSLALDVSGDPAGVRLERRVLPGLIVFLEPPVTLRIRNHGDAE